MKELRIAKVVLNIGVGEAGQRLAKAESVLEKLSGCKPTRTLSKSTNRDLGIRLGMPIGCKVTLSMDRLYVFLDRMVNIAIPRIRDFRGLNPKSFDKQ